MHEPLRWMWVPWYEIRFDSFQDSDGDGVGDIRGATERLPYIAELLGSRLPDRVPEGIGGIVWVTPFYPSPKVDGGYDVRDYVGIDPLYGTMADFDAFCAEAERLNLGIVVDLVLNHTSEEHPWFLRERTGLAALEGQERASLGEFYVWEDEQPEDWFRIIFNDSEWSNWAYDRHAVAGRGPLPVDAALDALAERDPERAHALRTRINAVMSQLIWPAVGHEAGEAPEIPPYDLTRRIEHMARTRPELAHRSIDLQEDLNAALVELGLPRIGRWYLHRFKTEQPDLNWYNPYVEGALLEVIDFWLSKPSVLGFRADAVPYAFLGNPRDGYHGENHPLTHQLLQRIRAHVDGRHPGRFVICEANMPPEQLFTYFGTPERPECHMVYDFTLTPAIPWAFSLGSARPVIDALTRERPPSLGSDRDLLNLYAGCHDEKTLEKVAPEVREGLWAFYCRDNPWDPDAPFDGRYRLNLGFRSRTAVWLGRSRARQTLLHALGIALEGSPLLYYGDEIGMGSLLLEDRDGLRLPMQWEPDDHAGFTTGTPFRPMIATGPYGYREGVNVREQRADPDSLYHAVRRLLHTRQRSAALYCGGQRVLETDNETVLAFVRYTEDEAVLVVGTFSPHTQRVRLHTGESLFDSRPEVPFPAALRVLRDMFTGDVVAELDGATVELELEPYGVRWFGLE